MRILNQPAWINVFTSLIVIGLILVVVMGWPADQNYNINDESTWSQDEWDLWRSGWDYGWQAAIIGNHYMPETFDSLFENLKIEAPEIVMKFHERIVEKFKFSY